MLATDGDALVCDLAEVYHITDWRELPVHTVAALACGLSQDSRIKMSLSGAGASTAEIMQAAMIDRLSYLVWGQTKDAQKGRNRPQMLVDLLTKPAGDQGGNLEAYNTPEAFEAARRRAMGGCGDNGH